MTRHLFRTALLAGGALAATAGTAAAQYPYPPNAYPPTMYGGGYSPTMYGGGQPYPQIGGVGGYPAPARPPVSPYLNILQGTGNPAVNYYNFARPQLQMQQTLQAQQSMSLVPLAEPFGLASTDVLYSPMDPTMRIPNPTGHPSAFMNYGAYFNSFGTIGTPLGRPGGAPAAARPMTPTPRR